MAASQSSLAELIEVVRSGWRIILAVALSALVGATLYVRAQPDQYDASAIVSLIPKATVSPDLVRIGAARYVSYITASATIRLAANELDADPVELQERVNASVAPDTGNITITVRQPSPERAVTVANLLASYLRRYSDNDKQLNADIVAPAERPSAPAAPPRRLIQASALFMGVLLGVGLAALRRAARVRSRPVIATSIGRQPGIPLVDGYPIVGRLPWSSKLEGSAAGGLDDPAVVEAGMALRANITQELGEEPYGVLLVTSPPGSHGKSTTARLLATMLVRSDHPVLLMGAHSDHPELSREPNNGLAGLREAGTITDTHQFDWVKDLWMLDEGLWVLPTWQDSKGSGPAAGRMAQVLNEARELFGTVVVDTPSLLGNDVSRTLTWLSNGVLLVVSNTDGRSNTVYRSTQALLHGFSVPFVGVVLNQIKRRSPVTRSTPQELPPSEA